jgi:hypothetical protein
LCFPEKDIVVEYDEEVKYHTALLAILAPLKTPLPGFKAVVRAHLMTKRRIIIATLQRWIERGTETFKSMLEPVSQLSVYGYSFH